MGRKLFWLAVIFGAFYLHSRIVFSDTRAMKWLSTQEQASLKGEAGLCEHLDDDFKSHVVYELPNGRTMEENHGKSEYCESLKDMAAALRVSQGRVNTSRAVQEVKISSFPWLRAEAVVDEETSVSMGGAMRSASVKYKGVSRYVFRRSIDGLKLVSANFEGEMMAGR